MIGICTVNAVGGDLHIFSAADNCYGAVLYPSFNNGKVLETGSSLPGKSVCGDIIITRFSAHKPVTDTAARQIGFIACVMEFIKYDTYVIGYIYCHPLPCSLDRPKRKIYCLLL